MNTSRPSPRSSMPGQERVGEVDRRPQVDGDQPVPRLALAGHERLHLVPAGVVHQDVDLAELRHERVDAGRVGEVDAVGGATLDRRGHLLGAGLVQVAHRDLGTERGEVTADGRTDAAGAAGDHGPAGRATRATASHRRPRTSVATVAAGEETAPATSHDMTEIRFVEVEPGAVRAPAAAA